jgi:REP element-mobilizing transposase RayT
MPEVEMTRRKSARLPNYDYRDNGAYFVTVVSHERACIFEESRIVRALTTEWARAVCCGVKPEEYEFVVMPNHVHGIVWLPGDRGAGARHGWNRGAVPETGEHPGTGNEPSTWGASPLRGGGCAPGSLGAVVGAFKSAATKRVNWLRETPGMAVWQRAYHERVIRSERHLDAVRAYILDNPRRWNEDQLNPGVG